MCTMESLHKVLNVFSSFFYKFYHFYYKISIVRQDTLNNYRKGVYEMDYRASLLKLIKEIEDTKEELNVLISRKGYQLTDEEVVELSEFLDQLLSEYHNLE